jgi:hypothetical protein
MFELFTASAAPKARRFSVGRSIAASALIGLGSLFAASSSLAANANFRVTVEPIPTGTSVGRSGLDTYAAYKVDIVNIVGNTTNAVRFSGSTDVTGDCDATSLTACNDVGAAAIYIETIPSTICSPGSTTTSFQCDLGQMKDGDPAKSFVLIFRAPALAHANHWAASAAIKLSWKLDYSSGGSSGSASSVFCNGFPCSDVASTNLITTDTTAILSGLTSYIPSFGGTFFIGDGLSARPSDPSLPPSDQYLPTALAKLLVPTDEGLTKAQVHQSVASGGGLTSDTLTTVEATFTVPYTSTSCAVRLPSGFCPFNSFVTIELRRDASTIKNGAKIANAKILYAHDDVNYDQNGLPACVNHAPTTSAPVCIDGRWAVTKKDVSNGLATLNDVGDWVFYILAFENGGFKF